MGDYIIRDANDTYIATACTTNDSAITCQNIDHVESGWGWFLVLCLIVLVGLLGFIYLVGQMD